MEIGVKWNILVDFFGVQEGEKVSRSVLACPSLRLVKISQLKAAVKNLQTVRDRSKTDYPCQLSSLCKKTDLNRNFRVVRRGIIKASQAPEKAFGLNRPPPTSSRPDVIFQNFNSGRVSGPFWPLRHCSCAQLFKSFKSQVYTVRDRSKTDYRADFSLPAGRQRSPGPF